MRILIVFLLVSLRFGGGLCEPPKPLEPPKPVEPATATVPMNLRVAARTRVVDSVRDRLAPNGGRRPDPVQRTMLNVLWTELRTLLDVDTTLVSLVLGHSGTL